MILTRYATIRERYMNTTRTIERILIALGGNAIKQSKEKGTVEEMQRNIHECCQQIAGLLESKNNRINLCISHGNGPQGKKFKSKSSLFLLDFTSIYNISRLALLSNVIEIWHKANTFHRLVLKENIPQCLILVIH